MEAASEHLLKRSAPAVQAKAGDCRKLLSRDVAFADALTTQRVRFMVAELGVKID
jgi:hypothetical protein